MHNDDLGAAARKERVQVLCRQLLELVELSRDQRRALEDLLTKLETLTEEARVPPRVRAAGKR